MVDTSIVWPNYYDTEQHCKIIFLSALHIQELMSYMFFIKKKR